MVVIFLFSTMAVIVPAQAHFTLGNLTGTSRYHANDFDPHVAGPIGYVWPGAGPNGYSGALNSASTNLAPGYQSPYPGSNPLGAPSNSWYQLEGDTYAPFGAVLTNSTGDLIFAINATCTPDLWSNPRNCATESGHDNGVTRAEIQTPSCLITGDVEPCLDADGEWDTWIILVPPEFTVPGAATHDASQIVSTLTNSYDRILVAKLSPDDRYAPGWTMIAITADGTHDLATDYAHQFIQFTRAGEWYYVRVNGVTAPSVAGRYFFKMALFSSSSGNYFGVGPTMSGPVPFPCLSVPFFFGSASVCRLFQPNLGFPNPFVWVPPQNWPVMLVKGEIDPAIMTGTLRYAGYNATLYGQPIAEAGKVWAHMTMRLDPYTGQQRPDLPTIDAQGYLNNTANGHFEVEGLAPGVYDVYGEATGYPQTLCQSVVTVLKGQSLHFDCYLQPGAVIHGNVFSKHQFGDEPWPGNSTTGQYMKIELYSNPTLGNIPDPSAGSPVSWSPLPCVAGGQEFYYGYRAAGFCGDPRDGSKIAFPWHEYSTINGAAYNDVPNPFTGTTNGYTRDVSKSSSLQNMILTSDPEGVGPPQDWYVAGGTTTPFHFEFGLKGEYGAPRDLSGEVPQVYATWINGLTPGRYYVRAWTFRYVQTALDGSTFQEYYFDVTPNEWAGDVTLPIDLRLSSWVNKTVYFHDTNNTLTTNPIQSGAGYMWGNLVGADGHVYAHNVTGLGLLETGVPNYYYSTIPITPPFTPLGAFFTPSTGSCFSYEQFSYSQFASSLNFFPTGEYGAPSQPCPFPGSGPHGGGDQVSALDKTGLNANSIATGKATIQFWGINDTWGGDDYGIPSGTYTPNVAVNGYYSQAPPEQVSVTLSGNPTSISDHLYLGPGFNVSVYSIDWERPRVSRDWVWSGCQDAVFLVFGTLCSGSEIDVGWYSVVNGTAVGLADLFGTESSFEPPAVPVGGDGLFQGPNGADCITGTEPAFNCVEMDGGGRDVKPGYSYHGAYFGQSAEYAFVGGYTAGLLGLETAPESLRDAMFTTPLLVWPLHFNQGQYNLAAYTYGYIQDKDFSAYAMNGQIADMKINLVIGVNVSLDILFKKESIITPTPYNMSARVRLFNDQNQLVAEWMSSEGTYVDRSGHAIAANGQLPTTASRLCAGTDAAGSGCDPLYPFNNIFTEPSSNLNGYNFLPGGTTLLHVLMAGLPQQPPLGNWLTGTYFGDPIATEVPVANALAPADIASAEIWGFGPVGQFGGCDFQLNCYPATYGQYPFPSTGIVGSPDYQGGWTAEVDFVPWYANNTSCTPIVPEIAPTIFDISDPLAFCPIGTTGSSAAQYYPPVDGLLMGESYHIIPGTTATSGISLTEDMALSSTFLGHSMAANHLGPYSQEGTWQISGTHNSGEASGIFEVDLNGYVSGNVLAFTWSNEFRPLSWGAITVTGAGLPSSGLNIYTFDGDYQAYLPNSGTAGSTAFTFTLKAPGYAPYSWTSQVPVGSTGTGVNVYLEQSNIPVPEFNAAPLAIIASAALAVSVYLLRRRAKRW